MPSGSFCVFRRVTAGRIGPSGHLSGLLLRWRRTSPPVITPTTAPPSSVTNSVKDGPQVSNRETASRSETRSLIHNVVPEARIDGFDSATADASLKMFADFLATAQPPSAAERDSQRKSLTRNSMPKCPDSQEGRTDQVSSTGVRRCCRWTDFNGTGGSEIVPPRLVWQSRCASARKRRGRQSRTSPPVWHGHPPALPSPPGRVMDQGSR